ncbi:MAG: hypothetical protein AAGA93_28360, partial [Actinomycetota bacterium]
MSDPNETTDRFAETESRYAERAAGERTDTSPYRFDPATIVHRTPEHPVRDGVEVMSPAFHADPFDHYRWMQANAPVYWDDVTGLWALTRHADIANVEANHETFCSVKGSRPESSVPSMINLDPPEHTRRR